MATLRREPESTNGASAFASELAASASAGVKKAYGVLRIIVSLGWAIYPIGYWMQDAAQINLIYNIADVVNKIAFGAIIWSIATAKHED